MESEFLVFLFFIYSIVGCHYYKKCKEPKYHLGNCTSTFTVLILHKNMSKGSKLCLVQIINIVYSFVAVHNYFISVYQLYILKFFMYQLT